MSFATLLLSAGRSRRMGQAKGWLTLDGESLLERITRISWEAGADSVCVVVGTHAKVASAPSLVSADDARRLLRNPAAERLVFALGEPDASPIDSIRRGLVCLPPRSHVLLWPVDYPFAGVSVVHALVQRLAGNAAAIALPVTPSGRRGHPLLLGRHTAAELHDPLADGGAHWVVRRDPSRVLEVPCADERVAAQLDTPEQAVALGVALSPAP